MKKDDLISMWQEGNRELFGDEKTDKKMIAQYLNDKTLKGSRKIKFNLLFYGALQLANIILISLNLAAYSGNATMTWILVPMLAFSVGILLYSMDMFYRLREINNYSDSLLTLIRKQLRFYRRPYELWQAMVALSVIVLINGLGFYVDYNGETYRINHPGVYVLITLGTLLFIYGAQKVSSMQGLKNLKAYLADMEKGSLDQSQKREGKRRKYLWLWIAVFILLTFSLIMGIIRAGN